MGNSNTAVLPPDDESIRVAVTVRYRYREINGQSDTGYDQRLFTFSQQMGRIKIESMGDAMSATF